MISKKALGEAIQECLAGNWARAHEIVMKDEENEFACWIHAVVHRREGDLSNARYWYTRCGHRMRKGIAVEEELAEIRDALGGR